MARIYVSSSLVGGYDEPKILPYAIPLIDPIGVDVRQIPAPLARHRHADDDADGDGQQRASKFSTNLIQKKFAVALRS